MLAIDKPIGGLVALLNFKQDITSTANIAQNAGELIDLMVNRSQSRAVEEVADGLLHHIFDLRMEVISWLANNGKDINIYLNELEKHIAVNLQLAPYSTLADTISEVLAAYHSIASNLLGAIPKEDADKAIRDIQNHKPDYTTFGLFALHPSLPIRFLKKWMDASLQLDAGIMLADLILTGQADFPEHRIKTELIPFLLQSITRFGAYSIITGFWKPDLDDTSGLVNDMEILAATIEMDNQSFYKASQTELQDLLNA